MISLVSARETAPQGQKPSSGTRNGASSGRVAAFASVILGSIALSALAPVAAQQQPQTNPPREDEAMTRARQTYDSLSPSERRAIQDNMVWIGIYKGIVDGEFGRMTFNAMRTYTSRRPGSPEGILSPQDRAALAAEAAKARTAVEFRMVQEPKAGFSIGIPQKVFTRRSDVGMGARFETADKSAGVETFRLKDGETTLQTLYDNYRAPSPGRRVTYSVNRPDFIVVTAETPTRASYTRVARGTAGGENVLRGFSISWPKAQQARYEILSIAIANSFDPFGQRGAVASADPKTPGTGSRDGSGPSGPVVTPPVAPAVPQVASSAIAFAPNRYLAVLPGGSCTNARVGNRTARLMRHDPVTGLALFDVPGGTGTRLRTPPLKAESNEAAVVVFASAGPGGGAAISAGSGDIAEIVEGTAPLRVRAPIPADAVGGLVISRKGHFLGLVAPAPPGARKIAGAPPPASRDVLKPDQIIAFLAASGLEFLPAQQNDQIGSVGKITTDTKGSIDALFCVAPPAPK